MTSRLLSVRRSETLCLALLAFGLVLYAIWIVRHIGADPAFRTLFIEEFHAGEAGRTRYLFGSWIGEGGGWQSLPFAPLASFLAALSYSLLGHSLAALRAPFVFANLASIALFAVVCWRSAPGSPLLAAGATTVFALSPFLSVLRPTSNNENLYPFIAVLLLFVLLKIEKRSDRKRSAWLYGIAGFIAGSALFVKVDGIVLPIAIAITMMLELISGRARFGDFVACGLGGLASIVLFVAAVCLTMGWREAVDSIAYSKVIFDYRAPHMRTSFMDRVIAPLLVLPKNFEVYFPASSFVLIPTIAIAWRAYQRLSLAERFSLVCVLILFVWSAFVPQLYWKKVTIVAVPLVFLHLAAIKQLLDPRRSISPSGLRLALVCSALLGIAIAASMFRGMMLVVPFWAVKTWNMPAVWAALAGTAVLLALVATFDIRKLALGVYGVIAGLVAVSGVQQITSFRPRHQLEKIGTRIGAIIGTSNVVADHNGFRFVSAFSDAHFRFFHENDPLFPAGITSEAQKTHAPFVLVTNTYKPVEKQIDKELPDYRKILRLKYKHPMNSFNDRWAVNTIVLYQRRTDGVERASVSSNHR
jgi:hypothetical protein